MGTTILFLIRGLDWGTIINYSESVLSKDVPEGTYITVAEAKNGVRPGSEIVRKWVEILQKTTREHTLLPEEMASRSSVPR